MQDPNPPYWCKFKGRQKISGLKRRILIQNPVQGKPVSHKALKLSISGSKFRLKRIHLSQVRVLRKNYRDQREFVAQHNSNIGTRRAQLRNISLGGFRLIELSYDYPLIRLILHVYKNTWGLTTQVKGTKESLLQKHDSNIGAH